MGGSPLDDRCWGNGRITGSAGISSHCSMDQKKTEPYIKETKDGSSTLFSRAFNQYYHNPNGAVAESRHVFFETSGLAEALQTKKELSILEIGFGTGLNLLLCLDYLEKAGNRTKVTFKSIEAYPIDSETAKSLVFGDEPFLQQNKQHLTDIFEKLKPGLNSFSISPNLQLELFSGFFEDYVEILSTTGQTDKLNDFILHDPFSPEVNTDLWTPEVFKKLAAVSNDDAILSTYCAATSARAAMAVAGWNVARAKGALGKREMTVASFNSEKLSSLKRVNEQRLIERYNRGDFNNQFNFQSSF